MHQSSQHLYGGCLAGAIWSKETENLAVLNIKGYPIYGIYVTIAFAQIDYADARIFH
jgi:hypothetical protein